MNALGIYMHQRASIGSCSRLQIMITEMSHYHLQNSKIAEVSSAHIRTAASSEKVKKVKPHVPAGTSVSISMFMLAWLTSSALCSDTSSMKMHASCVLWHTACLQDGFTAILSMQLEQQLCPVPEYHAGLQQHLHPHPHPHR